VNKLFVDEWTTIVPAYATAMENVDINSGDSGLPITISLPHSQSTLNTSK